MYLVFCVAFLLFSFNASCTNTNLFVIDLPNADVDGKVELNKLLHYLTQSNDYDSSPETTTDEVVNCLMDQTATKLDKITCLTNIRRNKLNIDSIPDEYYIERPKRTSLYNYYGGLLSSPFNDFTRQDQFSQDYLDLGDLSRRDKCNGFGCKGLNKVKKSLDFIPVSRRRMKESEESSETENSESSEEKSAAKNSEERSDAKKRRKPNRFQVVFNEDSSIESEEKPKKTYSSSEENEEELDQIKSESEEKQIWISKEVKKTKKSKEKYAYLQGNKIYDARKRLQHFLPKRFHWDEEDMYTNLGYYWFDGPKNKYTPF